MKLCYWESPSGNFGDDLNQWLWDFLLPGWQEWDPKRHLVGVGTILNANVLPAGHSMLVVGSGAGYGTLPDLMSSRECDIRAVRGVRTAHLLGLPQSLGIIDPAVMVSRMPEFQELEPSGDAAFVPHWQSSIDSFCDWKHICKRAGLLYISPCGTAKEVIRTIARSRLVIAGSMHAAIIADAFRVPWHAVSSRASFNYFKWQDWGESLELKVWVEDLYAPFSKNRHQQEPKKKNNSVEPAVRVSTKANAKSRFIAALKQNSTVSFSARYLRSRIQSELAVRNLERIISKEPNLSDLTILDSRMTRFEEVLNEIKKDFGQGMQCGTVG